MSRYIDADALEDKAKWYSLGYYEEDEWAVPFNETYDVPSIDIVFCKECKYYEAKEDWCYWRDEAITADDFCSYGERREP